MAATEPRRGGVARGGEVQRVRRWVQKLVEVPPEAEAKLELAGGDPARRAGGARHRRRNRAGEQTGEEDRDLNEISKVSGT